MDLSNISGYDSAIAAVNRYKSARMRHLETLDSYVSGTQYNGRPDWFSTDKPLWERAPCIVYPIARAAIDSNVDLVLGEQTFPTVCVPHGDDLLEDAGLGEDEAELVNRWLVEFEHYVRLRPIAREMLFTAQSAGSSCAIVAIRGGRPVVDTTRASWCTPTLDADGAVISLVIEYPFLQQEQAADGHWLVRAMLYRRTVDAEKDTTYKPAKLDGTKPSWSPATTVNHGLGFCPVIWYAHQKGCSTVADVDGHAIHENLLDEITALDFTLSQRHRAALYAGDPQWTEIGVEPGWNPSSGGRAPLNMPATMTGGPPSKENPITGYYSAPTSGKLRKKSPGDVWQYENVDTKVTLHTLPGDALVSLDNHAKDLKQKICEGLGVVFIDPENIPRGGELSAKAMNALRARQLDRCDSSRADFGDKCLRPLISMLIRIIVSRPAGLRLPGLAKVKPLLTALLERGLLLRLDWGPYSRPEPTEELALVQAAALALESGLATIRSAVLMTKDILCVEDIDEHVEHLARESEERAQKALDTARATADMGNTPAKAKPTTAKPKAAITDSDKDE